MIGTIVTHQVFCAEAEDVMLLERYFSVFDVTECVHTYGSFFYFCGCYAIANCVVGR